MKTDSLNQTRVVYIPASPRELSQEGQPIPRSHASNALLVALHVIFTIAFVLFCIGTAVAIWYFAAMFSNASYKAVVFFLMLILATNVAGKYVVWCIHH